MIEFRETKHAEDNRAIAWLILEAGNKIGTIEYDTARRTHILELEPKVGLLEQGDTDRIYEFIRNANKGRRKPATPITSEKPVDNESATA